MREILFRGKFGNEWKYGFLSIEPKGLVIKEPYKNESSNVWHIDADTVGQYTGLTDKNGQKIFEGDIVKGDREYFTYTHPYGRVIYDGGQFLIAFDDVLEDIECFGAWANAVEIIGNIHDNPELLEVQNDTRI